MNVASVGISAAQSAQTVQTKEPSIVQFVNSPEHGKVGDTVEISPRRANQSAMQRDEAARQVQMKSSMLRRMAERMIKEQYTKGNHWFMLFYGDVALRLDPSLRPESMILETDFEDSSQAAEQRQAVANAGEYFGPMETSRRILDTAMDIAGAEAGQPSKVTLDSFRTAVKTAFNNVKLTFGNVMPELTQRTYEATMHGFDAWAASGKTEG